MTSSSFLGGLLLASSLASAAQETAKEAAKKGVLPFITDDYPKALAAARAERKPIFLETWAPW
jgi:hypothetical protein